MNGRKWIRIALMASTSILILLSYQNCAKVNMADSVSSEATLSQGLTATDRVNVIDPIQPEEMIVSWSAGSVEALPNAVSIGLDGTCHANQHGSRLRWRLFDAANQQLNTALATCNHGTFHAEIPLSDLACGQLYRLQAQLGVGAPSELILNRPCP